MIFISIFYQIYEIPLGSWTVFTVILFYFQVLYIPCVMRLLTYPQFYVEPFGPKYKYWGPTQSAICMYISKYARTLHCIIIRCQYSVSKYSSSPYTRNLNKSKKVCILWYQRWNTGSIDHTQVMACICT